MRNVLWIIGHAKMDIVKNLFEKKKSLGKNWVRIK